MKNAVLQAIANRRSHRAYESTPVTDEQLQVILDACLQSPSAVNRQPWHISVVRDQQLLDEINSEVVASMQREAAANPAARAVPTKYHVFFHAPLVIFLSADPAWRYSATDCGIAVENMNLAAESLGLGCVILGRPRAAFEGARKAEFEKRLDFKPGEEFMIALSVGVATDEKDPHPIQEGHISFIG